LDEYNYEYYLFNADTVKVFKIISELMESSNPLQTFAKYSKVLMKSSMNDTNLDPSATHSFF